MIFHIIQKPDIIYPDIVGNDILDKLDMKVDPRGIQFIIRYNLVQSLRI